MHNVRKIKVSLFFYYLFFFGGGGLCPSPEPLGVCGTRVHFVLHSFYYLPAPMLAARTKFCENRTIHCRVMAINDVLQYGVRTPCQI